MSTGEEFQQEYFATPMETSLLRRKLHVQDKLIENQEKTITILENIIRLNKSIGSKPSVILAYIEFVVIIALVCYIIFS